MRSTGEVMARRSRHPDRTGQGRTRRGGRCRPPGRPSSRSATTTSRPRCRSRQRSRGSASPSSRPRGRHMLGEPGGAGDRQGRGRSGSGGGRRRSRAARPLRPDREHAAGERRPGERVPHPRAALIARVPCVTTISGAAAAVHAIANARAGRTIAPGADRDTAWENPWFPHEPPPSHGGGS